MTLTGLWLPSMTAGGERLGAAMRLKGKISSSQFKKIFSAYVVSVYVIILVNVAGALATIGSILLLTIPTMVIRDKFGELMRKEAREEKFVNLVLKQYDLFMQGYFELDDLKECLLQETGISFDEIRGGRLYD